MAASLSVSELVPRYVREVGSADRPAIRPGADGTTQPELLGGACPMAVSTEAANVAVVVRSTTAQRYYVVRNGCLTNDALGFTVPAKRFGP